MNVLLVNVAFNKYGGVKGHGGLMTPLNLCYLAAYCRQEHPEVSIKIIDAEACGLSHSQTVEQAVEFSADLVGITTNTSSFDSVADFSGRLKKKLPGVKIVLGGPHPSAVPERTLAEAEVDFAVIGEGEVTFSELVGGMIKGKLNPGTIPGLVFWKGDKIVVNQRRDYIKDLDALPLPARDLLDNGLYFPPPTKRVAEGPATMISTSRGCPFNCGFCGAKTIWQNKIRMRSAESVIEEIEHCINEYGICAFSFADEFFTANKKRVHWICNEIIERDLRIYWVCSARAQNLDLDTLKLMKRAGCHEISFGIESGNPEILKKIDKALQMDQAIEVIGNVKEAGITSHASYIFGYLDETEQTMQDTLDFALKLNTDLAAFFIASPLPGTAFYESAMAKGYIRKDSRWLDYSPLSNRLPVINQPGLSPQTVKSFHRKALRTYYLRPGYILGRMARLRHWYQVKNLVGGLTLLLRLNLKSR